MPRPHVDVVVPFRGDQDELSALLERLAALQLRRGDSLTVVDNTPERGRAMRRGTGEARVVQASDVAAPGYARNRGAAVGTAEWLVFIDADVTAPPDLLDRYFEVAPGPRTGLVAGAMIDEAVPPSGPPAARYAYIRRLMTQDDTFRFGPWGFPKTANVACRRAAFEGVGGFREDIRAGEDADLAFRLKKAGWEVERREAAVVAHRNRSTARAFAAQKLCHGGGIAWLDREYPGSFPSRRRAGLVWWAARHLVRGLALAALHRERDEALWAVFDPLELLTVEFGRSLPNERPLSTRALLRHLPRLRERAGVQRLDGTPPQAPL